MIKQPTWKPETQAKPWTTRDYRKAAFARRRRLLAKRAHNENYDSAGKRHPRPGPPMHQGPCVPSEEIIDRPSLSARLFKGKHTRTRIVAGKGHRFASFDRFGNRVWHPRYADVKICIVCKMSMRRVQAPKEGGA